MVIRRTHQPELPLVFGGLVVGGHGAVVVFGPLELGHEFGHREIFLQDLGCFHGEFLPHPERWKFGRSIGMGSQVASSVWQGRFGSQYGMDGLLTDGSICVSHGGRLWLGANTTALGATQVLRHRETTHGGAEPFKGREGFFGTVRIGTFHLVLDWGLGYGLYPEA